MKIIDLRKKVNSKNVQREPSKSTKYNHQSQRGVEISSFILQWERQVLHGNLRSMTQRRGYAIGLIKRDNKLNQIICLLFKTDIELGNLLIVIDSCEQFNQNHQLMNFYYYPALNTSESNYEYQNIILRDTSRELPEQIKVKMERVDKWGITAIYETSTQFIDNVSNVKQWIVSKLYIYSVKNKVKIPKAIIKICFPFLQTINLTEKILYSFQLLCSIDAPILEDLKIRKNIRYPDRNNLVSLAPIRKMLSKNIKSISMFQNHISSLDYLPEVDAKIINLNIEGQEFHEGQSNSISFMAKMNNIGQYFTLMIKGSKRIDVGSINRKLGDKYKRMTIESVWS